MRRGFILGGLVPATTVLAQRCSFSLDRYGGVVWDSFSVTIRDGRFRTVCTFPDSQ